MPLANGFCFGEGPRWFEGLLWFSDMLGEAVHTVNLQGAMTTLPLAGHAPSGLGFRPDGSLLIASTENRQVLRYDGDIVTTVADLSDTVPANLGDMVVDDLGRAYVGSQAREGGVIVRLDPGETFTVVAEDLDFPNGMVITPDGRTLIVAESVGRRLTAFAICEDGSLSDRRIFAEGLDGPPDGIALERWLLTFPSFGYLISVKPHDVAEVTARFMARGIAAADIGTVARGSRLTKPMDARCGAWPQRTISGSSATSATTA